MQQHTGIRQFKTVVLFLPLTGAADGETANIPITSTRENTLSAANQAGRYPAYDTEPDKTTILSLIPWANIAFFDHLTFLVDRAD
ncbi:hypothetical protein LAD77_00320 [Klebsiella pneumoniae]|nr:hypothetical protein [Klebsiella pneumoniae]